MLEPRRAPVRPRVISPTTGETLLLEDEILSLLERDTTGIVWLAGGPGSGKTTALAHLAAVLPASADVTFHDADESGFYGPERLIVRCSAGDAVPASARLRYQLAPWTNDEIIEYLLAGHGERCESIIRRLNTASDASLLRGNPELCRHVLDVLAADDSVVTAKHALWRVVSARLPDAISRELASSWCLAILLQQAEVARNYREQLEKDYDFPHLLRLLWHIPVLLLLAAEGIVCRLRSGGSLEFLAKPHPCDLVAEVANIIHDDQHALERLKEIIVSPGPVLHPMAASLLHAANIGWRPEPLAIAAWRRMLPGKKGRLPLLRGAYLENAVWPGIALPQLDVAGADLSGADLSNANLDHGNANRASLAGATLTGASLVRFRADFAVLTGADLSYIRAAGSSFESADALGATFEGALLGFASFRAAKLERAVFVRANLTGAELVGAEIEGADFSQAELCNARLTGLVLRSAEFRQCNFHQAIMNSCDLEGMILPGVDFGEAGLHDALLTGTVMPRANFRGANLMNAGLAEIDWEQADLRDADLRGASFHMGSSRSGLVDSPIASYGSRTGFYTDDYNEQDFKAPEEIRKADLRGADLRGANIDGVDFYLVDLRDAQYDAAQEQQFRSCGAILESRVP